MCKISCSCFPGNVKVILQDGRQQYMELLIEGDLIKAVSKDGNILFSPVKEFGHKTVKEFGHKNGQRSARYLEIRTRNKCIVLSHKHVLLTDLSSSEYKMVKDLKVGGQILIVDEQQPVKKEEILSIQEINADGGYVPFTEEGTVVVNGVVASCYAEFHPSIAHPAVVKSFRTMNAVLPKSIMTPNSDGVPRAYEKAYRLFKPLKA